MSTGILLFNYALVAIVAAIVAIPAVLIPLRLEREREARHNAGVGRATQSPGEGERYTDAA